MLFFVEKRFFSAFAKFLCRIISSFVEFCLYLWSEIELKIGEAKIGGSQTKNKHNHMKELAKHISVFVMLIGVAIMVISFLTNTAVSINGPLLLGTFLILNGFLGHIFVNNMKKGTLVSNIIWAIALGIVPYFIYLGAKKYAYSADDFAVYN